MVYFSFIVRTVSVSESGILSHPVSLLLVGAVRRTPLVFLHIRAVADSGHLVRTLFVDHPRRLFSFHPVVKPRSRHEDGGVHLGLHHGHSRRASVPWRHPCPGGADELLPFGLMLLRVQRQVDRNRLKDLNAVVHGLYLTLAAGVALQRRSAQIEGWNKS